MTRAYNHAELVALCQRMSPTLTQARGRLLAADNDEDEVCPSCNGSGEGMHDGTRCRACGGSGVDRAVEDDTRDWDAERKDRIERDLMERA